MLKTKNVLFVLLLPLLLAGCTTVNNLTPSQYPRNASGYYRVEASWRTSEETVRPTSIKAAVKVGTESYELRRVPIVQDRWETFIQVPADTDLIYYHYKFDFLKNSFGAPAPDSLTSREYQLRIVAPK